MTSILFLAIICIILTLRISNGCNAKSKPLERCYAVFIERDFFMVEDLFQLDDRAFDEQRFRLSDTDLDQLCRNFKAMHACYVDLFDSCLTYPFHAHLLRVTDTLRALDRLLCARGFDALQDMVLNGRCLERVRQRHFLCNDQLPDTDRYPHVFTRMLSFQAGRSVCQPLHQFKQCVLADLERSCDRFAVQTWNATIDTIVHGFCVRAPSAMQSDWMGYFRWADQHSSANRSSKRNLLQIICAINFIIIHFVINLMMITN